MTNQERKPFVVANWKLNNTIADSLKFITTLSHEVKALGNVEVAIAPPFTSLYSTGVALTETDFKLAAQNMYFEDMGAFTGETSPLFLKDVGCSYVLIGHSERRDIFKETDEVIAKKIASAIKNDLKPILCVGEHLEERESGQTWEFIESQLKTDLAKLSSTELANLTIAYEPIWAIGTGKTATPNQAEEVHFAIRNFLSKEFDGALAEKTRILYGGSVKAANAREIMSQANIDGVLVGGASLDPVEFGKIIHSA